MGTQPGAGETQGPGLGMQSTDKNPVWVQALWPTQAKACGELSRKEGLWIGKVANPGQQGGGSEERTLGRTEGQSVCRSSQGPGASSQSPAQPCDLTWEWCQPFRRLKICLTGWGLHKS